jgi:hypothetical protein
MIEPIDKEIQDACATLGLREKKLVLGFAQGLKRGRPKGTPGSQLLRFAGAIPPEDLDEMERAIEEGCEQIDARGW